ncbi:hypothetical protein BDV96DRAFT_137297 [Lophiotrema nucula]|uniref:BTB domain-containing protein n=1 Tax=Lophiotrema nucula TaxID=690887 RepID=A0A6A5ZV51_9PLEO|nr:hypothetical protein BDV96DRAFT_137297 [Lophiotrema nucula]
MDGTKMQDKVKSHIRRHFSQPIMKSRSSTHSPSTSDASTTSTASTLNKPPSLDTNSTTCDPKPTPDITGQTITIKIGGRRLLTAHESYSSYQIASSSLTHTPSETFHVHKSALATSLFFRRALRLEWIGPWATSSPDPITLPDEEPAVFRSYVQWLYFRALPPRVTEWVELANLYVLGEKLVDSAFQRAVLDAIIQRAHTRSAVPSYPFIKTVYGGTGAGSPVRKLVADFWVWGAKAEWDGFEKLVERTHVEFVNDLVKGLMEVRAKPENQSLRPWVVDAGGYLASIGCQGVKEEEEKVGGVGQAN